MEGDDHHHDDRGTDVERDVDDHHGLAEEDGDADATDDEMLGRRNSNTWTNGTYEGGN